ncbi:MAG: type II toxin-antitoxin system RelB/DinJ family antitoxin [Chitinivibrionia bacterium]|jgi:DNA-damage-inducible protein J|nr:type II toxin-antitoxin system RelB/DinJ family antitoxin [Chitinivibrionia bacterium]
MTKTISVRIDDGIKRQADEFFAGIGINTATALRMFIYSSVCGKKISFPAIKKPNARLLRAINDANSGHNLSPKFKTAKDAVASMLED